jgi:hypothetical protein
VWSCPIDAAWWAGLPGANRGSAPIPRHEGCTALAREEGQMECARVRRSTTAIPTTLLQLVAAVSEVAATDVETVAVLTDWVASGSLRRSVRFRADRCRNAKT